MAKELNIKKVTTHVLLQKVSNQDVELVNIVKLIIISNMLYRFNVLILQIVFFRTGNGILESNLDPNAQSFSPPKWNSCKISHVNNSKSVEANNPRSKIHDGMFLFSDRDGIFLINLS